MVEFRKIFKITKVSDEDREYGELLARLLQNNVVDDVDIGRFKTMCANRKLNFETRVIENVKAITERLLREFRRPVHLSSLEKRARIDELVRMIDRYLLYPYVDGFEFDPKRIVALKTHVFLQLYGYFTALARHQRLNHISNFEYQILLTLAQHFNLMKVTVDGAATVKDKLDEYALLIIANNDLYVRSRLERKFEQDWQLTFREVFGQYRFLIKSIVESFSMKQHQSALGRLFAISERLYESVHDATLLDLSSRERDLEENLDILELTVRAMGSIGYSGAWRPRLQDLIDQYRNEARLMA